MSRSVLASLLITLACMMGADLATAASPSLLPGMPREVPPLRDDRLDREGYEALVAAWRDYAGDHPASAVARAQLARAMRYANAPADEVREQMVRALELGPDCPEALDLAASTYLGEWEPLADGAKGCYELGLRAERLAPDWPDLHFTLYPLALAAGRRDEADRHAAALLDEGGIPAPVLDYCYNMLVGAAENAIVFTNGDNDTYGCVALQSARGLRPDVLVLNTSLLCQPEIRESLHAGLADGDPLTETRRRELYDEFISRYVRDHVLYSERYIKAVAAKAAAGELKRPIYLALTVSDQRLEQIPWPRRLEGLLWRLEPGEAMPEGAEPTVDAARTWQLFRDEFRLESATDLALPWPTHRSIAQLMTNYPAVLVRVAGAAAGQGDLATARAALREGLEIAAFHGREGTVAQMAEYWQGLDPDNPEIEAWLQRTD